MVALLLDTTDEVELLNVKLAKSLEKDPLAKSLVKETVEVVSSVGTWSKKKSNV